MDVLSLPFVALPPSTPLRLVSVRLTRDGEQTPERKVARLLTSELAVQAVFFTDYEATQQFAASAVDAQWLLLATDMTEPKRAAARYPYIDEDLLVAIDINDGVSGAIGSPVTLAARVRVDGVDAAREVLAVERQADGAWRIAGNLRTSDGDLELRVTGGDVYAMALDDYGQIFQPYLAVSVGDTIRPTNYIGWLYRITTAGTLSAEEPEWWPATDDASLPRAIGTAHAIAVRYYRPLAHGPVPVEVL